MTSQTLSTPFAQHLYPAKGSFFRNALNVAFGVALLSLLSQVHFYIGSVPITGQTFGVLFIAASFGATLGTLTVLTYLLVGALGLGVFAGHASGLAVFQGSTTGYLFGFLIAATVVGFLAQHGWDKRFELMLLAFLIGNILIYFPGLIWLRQFAPDWTTTFQWGLVPFIMGDIVKMLFAAALLPSLWQMIQQKRASASS